MLRRSIGDRSTVAFFEVPNVLFMLHALSVWDVIYEHYSYFSRGSLAYLFTANGFKVIATEDAFEGQYLTMDVEPVQISEPVLPDPNSLAALYEDVRNFRKNFEDKVNLWHERIRDFRAHGKRVVIWGAGSKGVTFLNALGIKDDEISYVVDINPRKTGMHVAGSGQRIVEPSFLRNYHPDVIIIMNAIYESEIRHQAQAIGLEADFLVA